MANFKILVAEDNKVNQLLITKILKKLNFEFNIVEDGIRAVEAGKTGEYNLIFMDINMPEMGGLEASSILRENGINIPIIAVTADSLHEEKQKMENHGITASIMKPFKIEEISEVISKYADSRA